MYRIFSWALFAVLFVLTACSSQQEQFCACMQKGEALDRMAREVLGRDAISPDEAKKLRELTEAQKAACKDFQQMGGDKMRELQSHCH